LPVYSAVPVPDSYNHSVGRFKTTYLARQIDAHFRGNLNSPIGVVTFVDIDNLNETSSFGRMVAEQLMSEMVMLGYNVIEMRKSEVIHIMAREGEFGLSRDLEVLRPYQDLSGIVVGTYVDSPERVYLNARVLDPRSGLIRSAGSVEMPKTKEIVRLIRTSTSPMPLERIPVRHLNYGDYPVPHYQRPRSEFEFYPSDQSTNQPMPMQPSAPPAPSLEPNA